MVRECLTEGLIQKWRGRKTDNNYRTNIEDEVLKSSVNIRSF